MKGRRIGIEEWGKEFHFSLIELQKWDSESMSFLVQTPHSQSFRRSNVRVIIWAKGCRELKGSGHRKLRLERLAGGKEDFPDGEQWIKRWRPTFHSERNTANVTKSAWNVARDYRFRLILDPLRSYSFRFCPLDLLFPCPLLLSKSCTTQTYTGVSNENYANSKWCLHYILISSFSPCLNRWIIVSWKRGKGIVPSVESHSSCPHHHRWWSWSVESGDQYVSYSDLFSAAAVTTVRISCTGHGIKLLENSGLTQAAASKEGRVKVSFISRSYCCTEFGKISYARTSRLYDHLSSCRIVKSRKQSRTREDRMWEKCTCRQQSVKQSSDTHSYMYTWKGRRMVWGER